MICFEVIVNGEKLCKAGVDEPGDLHAHVIWVLRHGQFDYSGTRGTDDESMSLSVDGQVYRRHEFVSWPNMNLKTGDEVIIRIVEADSCDEPTRTVISEADLIERRRELYERLKKHFEGGQDAAKQENA